jgi:hypothetical protein
MLNFIQYTYMSRKKPKKEIKVPRKVAVRRSATKEHQNKYADKSKLPHTAYGVLVNDLPNEDCYHDKHY